MTVIMLHGVFICHVLDQILYFYRVKLQLFLWSSQVMLFLMFFFFQGMVQ